MNSIERMTTALKLRMPDQVPVAPWAEAPVCIYLGEDLNHGLCDGECLASVQSLGYQKFKYDMISIGHGLAGIEPEALGCQVKYSMSEFPVIEKPSIVNPKDIDKIVVPDPMKYEKLAQYFQGIRKLKRSMSDRVPICLLLYSPFAIAARIRGVNPILMDVYDNVSLVHKLMEICTENQLRIGKAAIRAGVEMFFFGADMEGPVMISPSHYDEFCKAKNEYLLGELIRDGAYILFHMCGQIIKTGLIERILATGSQAVGPGQISTEEILDIGPLKTEYGDKICIFGNLNPNGKLLNGTPLETEREVCEVLNKGKDGGGFVFHTGGTLSPETPLENFEAMIRAARQYGMYV